MMKLLSMVWVLFLFSVVTAWAVNPERLILTWQRDPLTTMTIQWLESGTEALPATVDVWPAGSPRSKAVTWETSAHVMRQWPETIRQRVEVTGLEPGTAYRFAVSGSDLDLGFRTMPSSLEQPLRLAIGGDTRHRQDWMERVNRVAMQYRPDLIVWGGDFSYADGLEENLYRWHEWFDANYKTLIDDEGFVVPLVVCIGNHEIQKGSYRNHEGFEHTDEWRERIAPYFYQLFAYPGHPGYGALDFGDYMSLILLDTEHSGAIRGAQTEWLEEALATRTHIPHVFPVYHVPAWPSHRRFNGPTQTRVRELWVPLFERYGVRLAFEHHDHTYKRTHPLREGVVAEDGIVYFGDGAWGVGTRDINEENRWYLSHAASARHAIIMTLHGTHRHVLVVREDGTILDEYPEGSGE